MKAIAAAREGKLGEVTALNWHNKLYDPRAPEEHNKGYLSW